MGGSVQIHVEQAIWSAQTCLKFLQYILPITYISDKS